MLRIALLPVVGAASLTMALASTYHVSPSGQDTNNGSAPKPWRTIQYACDKVAAGDKVVVHGGTYSERVVVRRSMILTAAPGERPVLDGAGVAIPAQDAALIFIKDLDNVTVSGFEIANYKTTKSSLCPIGILIRGKANKVKILRNVVHHVQNTGSSAGDINAFGIVAYGDSSQGAITNLLFEGNEIYGTKTGNSETMTVNGNVNGFQISNNYVHDVDNIGIDCIGFEKTSPIKDQDYARNGVVTGNRVVNVSSYTNPAYHKERSADGIYVDGGSDIVIERNSVTGADIGIEVTSEHGGRDATGVIVRSNLVTASNTVGLSIGGYDKTRGGTRNCAFVNNTFVGNDTKKTESGEFQIQYHTSGNTFTNNIFYASKQGILISSRTGAGSAIGLSGSRNLYYTPSTPKWIWNGKTYPSLAAFSKAANEANSLYVDPKFRAAADYQLSADSPAVNTGVFLSFRIRGSYDLAGTGRVQGGAIDIGAYEFLAETP